MRTLQKRKHTPLKNMLMITGLLAVTWVVAACQPSEAKAEVRVRANIQTPVGRVIVDTGPQYLPEGRYHRARPVVVREQYRVVITKADRKVAQRLARLTGYSKHELLDLRSAGYSWYRIGAMLRIEPELVHVAMDQHRFQRRLSHHPAPVVCRR